MKTIMYSGYISFECLDQVEDAMTIEDIKAFKKLYTKLENDMMARRMYSNTATGFSSNDFKQAFYMGYLAAHCVDQNSTPLGQALSEDV